MTQTQTEHDVSLEQMVGAIGEFAVPCDYSRDKMCNDHPAEWVMYKACPECHVGGPKLVCTDCKDARVASEAGVYCKPGCGEVITPARRMYRHIEPL